MIGKSTLWICIGLLFAGQISDPSSVRAQTQPRIPYGSWAGQSALFPDEDSFLSMLKLQMKSSGENRSQARIEDFCIRVRTDEMIDLYELGEEPAVIDWRRLQENLYGDEKTMSTSIGAAMTPEAKSQALRNQIRDIEALEKELARESKGLTIRKGRHVDGRHTDRAVKLATGVIVGLTIIDETLGLFPAADKDVEPIAGRVVAARKSVSTLLSDLDEASVFWWPNKMTELEARAAKYEAKAAKGASANSRDTGIFEKGVAILTRSIGEHRSLLAFAERSGINVDGISTPVNDERLQALQRRSDNLVAGSAAFAEEKAAKDAEKVAKVREQNAKEGKPIVDDYSLRMYARFERTWSVETLAKTYGNLTGVAKMPPPRGRRQLSKIRGLSNAARMGAAAKAELLEVPETDTRRGAALAELGLKLEMLANWAVAFKQVQANAPAAEIEIAPLPDRWQP